jgi:mannitol/fructose-specific phosphotransferase system IIA component (Ntr-type)
MKISPLLRPEFILLELQSTTRLEALHELTQLVKAHPHVKDFAAFCRAVHEREAMGSTALAGHDIAIPHARTDQVSDILLAVGRSASGVLFEGKEPQTVRLIFLMGTPKKMVMEYLQLLGSLAKLLKEESFRAALLAAQTPEDFLRGFQEHESSQG